MEKNIDQLKQELVHEIKDLAAEIAKSNSFVGMLSNEIKFRALHEKFINLKFLERKHIGLDVFDQPIPLKEEKQEVFSDAEIFPDETIHEYDFQSEQEVDISDLENEINIESHEIENPEDLQDDFTDLLPQKQFPKIKIDFNDKIAFLNQLFVGEASKMDFVMDTFNQMNSLHDARLYLSDLKHEMDWKNKEEYVERLETLIVKRFE